MPKRSKFSLSNYKLFSCDMGELIPAGLTEVLPGDSIQQSTSILLRCSPMIAPVMHPVDVQVKHFFVPHRLVWDEFDDFITGGEDGLNASVFPTITFASGVAVGSLGDYLGVPTGVNNIEVSALPFRGYALIYNEMFRDQDLQAKLVIDLTSGPDTTTSTALQNVNWEKDYFTSARPWEQKGDAITVSLGASAPITATGTMQVTNAAGTHDRLLRFNSGTNDLKTTVANTVNDEFRYKSGLLADLSAATGLSVNDLREALALQRMAEARARYGSRYTEYLRFLGVRSSDSRLQRPEFLGGGRQKIQFSEVLQTAEGTDPVGSIKGHGIAAMRSNRYRRYFEEHGYVFTFLSVRPKTMYAQGLARTWNRRTKEDFWQKELQHIGQQEVLNKELYAAHASPNNVFGYQNRYDEYRRSESSIAGEFRSTVLDYWHMARLFSSAPTLNDDFVTCTPTERNFAVPSYDVLYVMANHSIQARRLVSGSVHSAIA